MSSAERAAKEKTYTTREVAEMTGMADKALQYLVREGKLAPHTTGKPGSKARRIWWKDADVEAVRAYKDDEAQSKKTRELRDILLDLLDSESIQNLSRARQLHCPPGAVVCAGPEGARVVQRNDSVRTLIGRIGGYGIILPPR